MKIINTLFLALFLLLRALPAVEFEQGYVANKDGWFSQTLNPRLLPTEQVVKGLAVKFGAKVEDSELVLANFRVFVPVDQKAPVDFMLPFTGEVKPAIVRYLVFPKGKVLPGGYVLEKEVKIAAWFFADAFLRKDSALAEADCWQMIETHDKQSK